MQITKNLIAVAATLLLVGAGCSNSSTNGTNTNEKLVIPEAATETSTETTKDTETKTETAKPAEAKAEEGWQVYTNAALGFTFNWPSKGVNAPTWAVQFPKDADLKDGCVTTGGAVSSLKVGEYTFCHVASEVANGTANDSYTTKVGTTNVTLAFTKKSTNEKFDWAAYRKSLDEVVATFAKK